ncbi:non-specific lipid transfer protein GPI-anchored 1 [Iris pallida]|uniref:Non-specific lipid transfer protein GPI-anchored 1 n=1 Tax=Iris pallida TaxID=29817 RepID=A0AAX6FAS9_IRIPA|nr:non-specific lipid transfer protein GPI-anchored 1 [Iris pallida]
MPHLEFLNICLLYLSPLLPLQKLGQRKRKMKSSTAVLLFLFLSMACFSSPARGGDSPSSALQDKCSPVITKLGECLSFASGKADTPSGACCSTVADIRKDNPVCLCYIIQTAHGGGSGVTGLGLQMDKLIQLPAACKLADTDITNCPKLLNLPPSSPDYAIFSNSTKASSSATPAGSKPVSEGAMHHRIHFLGTFAVAAVSAILLSVF